MAMKGTIHNYKQNKIGEVVKGKYRFRQGKLVPTDIGTIVTDFLVKNFGIY
jgi:DNA topoisomerase-1